MNTKGLRINKRRYGRWLIMSAIATIGTYCLMIIFSPAITLKSDAAVAQTLRELKQTKPAISSNRLHIPKLGVDIGIQEAGGNEERALSNGALHRKPQNGNPESGGNFVLAAHRFSLGLTPDQTVKRSPFYHIDKLELGDDIFIDYLAKRYIYSIIAKKHVTKYDVEIEAPTDAPQLTLYSCDLEGSDAGRIVITAQPR